MNLVRSFADYSPSVLRATIRDGYDGYIFVAPKDRDTNALYAKLGAPVVFIDQPSETTLDRIPNSILVYDDNDAIGKAAAQRLMTAPNVKSFAFVGITQRWSNERGDAFMRELWRRGRNELRPPAITKWPCRSVEM